MPASAGMGSSNCLVPSLLLQVQGGNEEEASKEAAHQVMGEGVEAHADCPLRIKRVAISHE